MMDLVARVKAVQKTAGGQALWSNFVQQAGGGKNDPALRPPEFLQTFLTIVEQHGFGVSASVQNPIKPPFGGQAAAPSPQLVSRVKEIQRTPIGRQAWATFVEMSGDTRRDPALRTPAELQKFLAEWENGGQSQMPSANMMQILQMGMGPLGQIMMAKMLSQMGGKSPQRDRPESKFVAQSVEHANLIARVKALQNTENGKLSWNTWVTTTGTGIGKKDPAAYSVEQLHSFLWEADPAGETSAVKGSFDERKALAAQVKKGQTFSEEFKEAWIQYTDDNAGGVRDPARHDAGFLRAFLQIAPPVQTYEGDDEHAALVLKVKQGQRSSPVFKAAWIQYCAQGGNGKNDPARHDSSFLSMFLDTYNESTGTISKGSQKGKGKVMRSRPY